MSRQQGGQRFGKSASGGGGRPHPQNQPRSNQGFGGSQGGGYRAGQGGGGGQQGGYGQGGGQLGGPPRGGGGFRGGPRGGGRGGRGEVVPERPIRVFKIVQMGQDENHSTFKGALGQRTKLVANYFRMDYKDGKQLNQYRVDYYVVKENEDRKKITTESRLAHRARFWKFVQRHEPWFMGRHNLVYDDSHLLYTVEPLLHFGEGDLKELEITEPTQQGKEVKLLMVIKRAEPAADEDSFRVLNLILTQFARCPIGGLNGKIHCEISRMFIKPLIGGYHQPLDLGEFQLVRGVCGFAKRGLQAGQAFANYDVTHSAFYKVGIDILQFYAFAKRGRFLNEEEELRLGEYGMRKDQRDELRSLLSGLKLKKKKVADGIVESEAAFCNVIAQNASTHCFKDDKYGDKAKGGMISVQEYYWKRYGYRIRYPTMPLIQLMPENKKLMVPIEVLRVSDRFQRLRRKLPDVLQAKTNKFTNTHPRLRFSDIDQMVREEIQVNDDPFLRAFDVGIDRNLNFLEIGARILPQPNCEFARDPRQLVGIEAVEGPQHEGNSQVQVLFDLIIVNRCVEWNGAVWNNLVESCRQRGIDLLQTEPLFNANNKDFDKFDAKTVHQKIAARVDQYKKLPANVIPICIVFIPNNRTDIYAAFKGIFELRFGVRSQVIRQKTYVEKLVREVGRNPMGSALARNIFLKINAKCGGVNCRIQADPTDDWFKFVNPQSPTMFIGIDVTHPAPGDSHSPSISALVGNIDVDATRLDLDKSRATFFHRYTATVRAQHRRTEWIQNMHSMVVERLKHFKKGMEIFQNEVKLPAKIVVFRDGVSESQFEGLKEFELPGIRKAIDEFYGTSKAIKPKITFLVVQKRHSTRFYDRDDPNDHGNPKPGTVVDGFITSQSTSHSGEFYLCSHKGIMGTSKPAHYFVIHDENGFTADDVEVCANNLCHLFARAPMPVSIPAPVYYAHLACFRARHHWAAADDGLPVGKDGQPLDLERGMREGEDSILKEAVVVEQNLKPTMYFC